MVVEGKSYLMDSRQLIAGLRNFVAHIDDIVTIDVNLLYASIIQGDGISSVEWALYKWI